MNEGDPKGGLGKVSLDRGFLPQPPPAHVTGTHSPHFVITGKDSSEKQTSLRTIAIWSCWLGVNSRSYLTQIPALGLPKDRALWSPAQKTRAFKARGYLRVGWPWWVHAGLGWGPEGKVPAVRAGWWRSAQWELYLLIHECFRPLDPSLGKKIQFVSPSPSSTSRDVEVPGSAALELGSDGASSFISLRTHLANGYWAQMSAGKCDFVSSRGLTCEFQKRWWSPG